MEFECLAKSLPRSGDSDPHLASFLKRRIFDSTHETGRRSVCSAATWLSFPAGFPERLGNNLVTFLPIVSEAVPLEWKIKLTFLQENKIGSAALSPSQGLLVCFPCSAHSAARLQRLGSCGEQSSAGSLALLPL